jgi:hypothetical protein
MWSGVCTHTQYSTVQYVHTAIGETRATHGVRVESPISHHRNYQCANRVKMAVCVFRRRRSRGWPGFESFEVVESGA